MNTVRLLQNRLLCFDETTGCARLTKSTTRDQISSSTYRDPITCWAGKVGTLPLVKTVNLVLQYLM